MTLQTSRRNRRLTIAAALLGTALTSLPALAQDATWDGTTDDYNDPNNWTPTTVPTDDAILDATGSTLVNINSSATINQLLIDVNAQNYNITNFATYTVNGAGIVNASDLFQVFDNRDTLILNNSAVIDGGSVNGFLALTNGNPLGGNTVTMTFNDTSSLIGRLSLSNVSYNATAIGGLDTASGSANVVFNDSSSADSIPITTTGGSAVAIGSSGTAAVAIGGVANFTFNDTSHADTSQIVNSGGVAVAMGGADATETATAIGGIGNVVFNGDSHADLATILNVDGGAVAVGGLSGATATAIGGIQTVTFNDASHADGATFGIFGGGVIAVGGSGDTGTPGGTGATGGVGIAIGGVGVVTFNGTSHADGASFSNTGSVTVAVGGTGGNGDTGNGGIGGTAQAVGSVGTVQFNDDSHATNATFDNIAGLTQGVGGTGGTGGVTGTGGAGGVAIAVGGGATTQLNGNATIAGSTITNTAATAIANGGTGGTGGGAGAGGAGGNSTVVAGSASVLFTGNSTAGAGTTIINQGGNAEAYGGAGGVGGTGAAGAGGDGGQAIATGGIATVHFIDNASAGSAHIYNTPGTATAITGSGGDGDVGNGGNGGSVTGQAGNARVIFSGNSTAANATIEQTFGTAIGITGGGSGAPGAGGGAGGSGGVGSVSAAFGEILFEDDATGGAAHIINSGGFVRFTDNAAFGTSAGALIESNTFAQTLFENNSSLGSGAIVNSAGGVAVFNDSSTAGTGTITNLSAGAGLQFFDTSTAGAATINNMAGGTTLFTDNSTAGTATINNAGTLLFSGTSDAVAARVIQTGAGSLSIGGTTSGLRLGSLSGTGTVDLGSKVLQVGYLDLNETFSGVISGVGGQVIKRGTGTLTLSGTNTFSGGLTATDGTVQLDSVGGAGVGAINLSGGNVRTNVTGTLTTNQLNWTSGSTSVFSAAAGTTVTLTGSISAAAPVAGSAQMRFGTVSDTGTIILGQTAGALTNFDNISLIVQGGTLRAASGNGVLSFLTGTVGSTTIDAGATLDFNGVFGAVKNLLGAGTLTNSVDTFILAGNFAGSITGAGSLTKISAGTLILTGANTYTGTTTISSGVLQIGNGGTTGTLGTGAVVNNASLVFNRSDSFTVGNDMSGTGTLTKQGAGTLTLTGANTYAGLTTISAGTLQIGNGGTIGSITGDIANSAALIFNRSDAITYGGVVSGTGTLTKQGAGTLILTNANTYTGVTTVSAGTLQIGNGGTTGSVASQSIVNNANLAFNRSDTITYAGVVSGTGTLTKQGTGTLILTNDNTYTGTTTISGGILQIGAGSTTGSIASQSVVNNSNLTFNRSDNITYGGVVSGTGSLTKQGAGTLILSNNNTYAGPTTISAGTLQIGNGGTTGSVASSAIVNNSALVFNRSDAITYGGVVSGTGTLTKIGAGTLTLSGANTYTGATTVSAGTLALTGSVASNTTVAPGAALTGTGTITGTLTANGTVAPGSTTTPLGTLTVTGNATFNAGSFLQPTVAAAGQTSLLQAGSLTINGGQVRPVSATGGLFLMQTDYRIAVGTAGRTGTFTGIDESLLPTFLDGTLIYGATDVTLRLRRNATNFAATTGLTPNENALSVALDAAVTANNPAVYSTYLNIYNSLLTAASGGTLGAQLDTLSGDALTAFPLAEHAGAERFGDRLAQYTWSNSSNVWLLAAYYDDNADSDGNGPGFDAQAWEFQAGFATSLGESTRLGFSAGMSNGDIDVDQRATVGDLDTWSLGVHLRHDLQGFYFAGQGTYSWHSVDTERGLLLGGSAIGEFDAKTWTAGAEVGVSLGGDSLAIEPHATLRHADTSQDAYTESGGTGALVVAAQDYQTTRYGLGVRLANRQPDAGLRYSAMVRYELQSGDDTAVLDNTLPSLPTFTVVSTELGDDIITAEVGVEANVSAGFSLFFGAGAHWRSNENGYQANAGARIVF